MGCRILIACRCACPGATTITKLSWVQEPCLTAAGRQESKNRDNLSRDLGKQLTFIVRVRVSFFLFIDLINFVVRDNSLYKIEYLLDAQLIPVKLFTYSYCYTSFFVSFSYIFVSFNNLFQWITSINYWFYMTIFNQLFD